MTEVFMDGRFVGETKNAESLVEKLRELRRSNKIPDQVNFSYLTHQDTMFINTNGGRARRPLIIVENGTPKLTSKHMEDIEKGVKKWSDLIREGVIEYLDAEEEENAYVALRPADITKEHTHLELDPTVILGISTSLIPFPEFNRGDRVNFGSKMVGQSIGLFLLNFLRRVDTKSNIMVYPQAPIVKTHMHDIINTEDHPGGQNLIIGIMSYKGFNMEDGVIINKASIERGLFWSYLFRTYETEEKRYMGGQEDVIGIPEPGVRGYGGEDVYKHLSEDGIADPETEVTSEQIIIGKTSPLRFLGSLDQFITGLENVRETSIKLRHGENGIVDRVFLTESNDGNKLIKLVIRDLKRPELGDKVASRHGQKGVIGLIVPQEDMPFTKDGIIPDLLFNPLGIPSRMTMGKLLEIIAAKMASLEGKSIISPPFHSIPESELREKLKSFGFSDDGRENLYVGETGTKFQERIFIGSVFYQKLDHLVSNKIHARSRGPTTLLTKQPTEGKAKRGGLRLGEMEKDALIAHGSSLLLKERLDSDRAKLFVCKTCGLFSVEDRAKNKVYCAVCGDSKATPVEISYAFKLLLDELKSMLIYPKIVVKEE
ncbi:DNA-directed RNA polymerase subunit B [Candidatus Micrarchaeota archaeon RBG_16_49_10]|nr:MAG: DNA-directed RNA polymerase subunit B [Candidatus Micrarchaeota archaeon RBG_16_49_10]